MPEPRLRHRGLVRKWTMIALGFLVTCPTVVAQSTTAGAAIDVEILNPVTGNNTFCVTPGETFSARLWVSPGTGSAVCAPACGTTVPGGSSHLAAAVIDIAFDTSLLGFNGGANNPDTTFAAVDGLIQDNSGAGRVGWALAGDWTPDGDATNGVLQTPCTMKFLDTAGWVAEFTFTADAAASGTAVLHIRRQDDASPFPLSFADICSKVAFTESSGGIDEIADAVIHISDTCSSVLFLDGFENGSASQWSDALLN